MILPESLGSYGVGQLVGEYLIPVLILQELGMVMVHLVDDQVGYLQITIHHPVDLGKIIYL